MFVKIKIGSPIEKNLLDARTKASHTNDHQKPPYHLQKVNGFVDTNLLEDGFTII
jgi:hypothetical protein